MKKKMILMMLSLMITAFTLSSCIGGDKTTESSTSDTSTEPGNDAQPESYAIVKDGVCNYKIIRPDTNDDTVAIEGVKNISNRIQTSGGVTATLGNDFLRNGETHDSESLEILVGDTNYEETAIAKSLIKYTQYGIIPVGNKICIIGFSPESLRTAINRFSALLMTSADETTQDIVVQAESLTAYDISDFKGCPPTYDGAVIDGVYDCNDNNYKIFFTEATNDSFNAYKAKLSGEGYTLVSEYDISVNRFATYTKDGMQYSLALYPEIGEASIQVAQSVTKLPEAPSSDYTPVTPIVIQVKNPNYVNSEGKGMDGSMGYIIRLEDSSFIIIDGGLNRTSAGATSNEHEELMTLLRSQNLREDNKIIIRAWVITHSHSDHYNVLQAFQASYASAVTVENLIFNPMAQYYQNLSDTPSAWDSRNVLTAFKGCNYIKATAGQKLAFAGCEVEILMSSDDAYKCESMYHINDSSIVMRFKIKEQTFLVLGDIEADGSARVVEMWGSYLKSDIVQVAHHGCFGGSIELYDLIQPEVVLWPTRDKAFTYWQTPVSNQLVNIHLVNMPCVKLIKNSGRDGNFFLELPYTIQ